jgi:glucokinase
MKPDFRSNQQSYAIGLDVGGTKIAGGVVNLASGVIEFERTIPTRPDRGGQAVLADTVRLAENLLNQAKALNLEILGIGLGAPELVDLAGNITSAHAVAWQDLPVQETLAQLAPAVVESDVRAAALGEAHFGSGRPLKLFVYITVGTGISCCLVQDGQPYAGARGNALILASSPLTTTCHVCGTTLTPILEEFASGPALVARYNRQAQASVERGEDVLAAVEAGDEVAVEIVKTAGEALGVSVGWLANVLDPEAVIVGGGLGSAKGLYWDSFVASTRRHIWSETNRDLPILAAALGPEAGVVGAAAAILQKKMRI